MKTIFHKSLFLLLLFLLCATILLFVTFYYFPILGHDYSYVVPNSIEFNLAWNKFGVLNPHFSPTRCLGLPMWSNPISANFSFLHFYSLFFNPLYTIALYIITFSLISFCGAFLFTTLFLDNFIISSLMAVGWTLQAHFVNNVIVGHTSYMIISFFPFVFYLILKKHSNLKQEFFYFFLLVFLIVQFVFSGAHSAPFIFISSFIICLALLWILNYDLHEIAKNIKFLFFRNIAASFVIILISIPKLLAVMSWLSKYPRKISFLYVGFKSVLEYSYYNLLIPTPFDAQTSVGWWYGNWESNQGIFPCLIISLVLFLISKSRFRPVVIFLGIIFSLFLISVFINSGVYSNLFSHLPVLNSLHVNPRWNTIILLPLFTGLCLIIKKHAPDLNKYLILFLYLSFLIFPFLFVNKVQNQIIYPYMQGYDSNLNRLSYCYEPVFGYSLENFPINAKHLNLFGSKLVDPRCYLSENNCEPGSIINNNDQILLESYRLK